MTLTLTPAIFEERGRGPGGDQFPMFDLLNECILNNNDTNDQCHVISNDSSNDCELWTSSCPSLSACNYTPSAYMLALNKDWLDSTTKKHYKMENHPLSRAMLITYKKTTSTTKLVVKFNRSTATYTASLPVMQKKRKRSNSHSSYFVKSEAHKWGLLSVTSSASIRTNGAFVNSSGVFFSPSPSPPWQSELEGIIGNWELWDSGSGKLENFVTEVGVGNWTSLKQAWSLNLNFLTEEPVSLNRNF